MSRITREILTRENQSNQFNKQPWERKITKTNNFGDEPKPLEELLRKMTPEQKKEYFERKKTADTLEEKWKFDEKLKKEATYQGDNREMRSIGGKQNKKYPHTPIGGRRAA